MLYFLHDTGTGLIKIGHSEDPWLRMKQLQVGASSPLRLLLLMEGGYAEEQELQAQFSFAHQQGEWFLPHEKILQFIEGRNKASIVGRYFIEMSPEETILSSGRVAAMLGDGYYLLEMDSASEPYEKVCHISSMSIFEFYSSHEYVMLLRSNKGNRIVASLRKVKPIGDELDYADEG